jgi:hypothetical protein
MTSSAQNISNISNDKLIILERYITQIKGILRTILEDSFHDIYRCNYMQIERAYPYISNTDHGEKMLYIRNKIIDYLETPFDLSVSTHLLDTIQNLLFTFPAGIQHNTFNNIYKVDSIMLECIAFINSLF